MLMKTSALVQPGESSDRQRERESKKNCTQPDKNAESFFAAVVVGMAR